MKPLHGWICEALFDLMCSWLNSSEEFLSDGLSTILPMGSVPLCFHFGPAPGDFELRTDSDLCHCGRSQCRRLSFPRELM